MRLCSFLLIPWYYQNEKFIQNALSKHTKAGGKILDAGSGNRAFKKYSRSQVYDALDFRQNKTNSIDIIADLNKPIKQIPSNTYDAVVSVQVLEHLKNPNLFFSEMKRILKPKGILIISTNFFYPLHMEPNDYYRFTRYGLMHLGKSSGLKPVFIESQGGPVQTVSYLFFTLLAILFLKKYKIIQGMYYAIIFIPFVVTNLFSLLIDHFIKTPSVSINYGVIYKKSKNS